MSSQPGAGRNTALTFGIEIEFCVASLDSGYEDPHPHATPQFRDLDKYLNHPKVPNDCTEEQAVEWKMWFVQLRIAEALSAAGYRAVTEKEIDDMNGRYPEDERLSHWIVTSDVSLRLPNTDLKYEWYNIEVNSPAYYFNPAAVDEVKKVCNFLKANFRIHINNSMGVHIHVGDGKNGLEAYHLRSLMATLFVFEPQLDTLHPKHRIGRNFYCKPLNTESRLGKKSVLSKDQIPNPKTKRQILEELLQMDDRQDILYSMMAGDDKNGSKLAYNVSNLLGRESKRTIEFRQHESTLDANRIAAWIELCVALVEVPLRESRESLEALLRDHVDDTVEEFDVIKVLLVLNLPVSADFYDARFYTSWVNAGRTLRIAGSETSSETSGYTSCQPGSQPSSQPPSETEPE